MGKACGPRLDSERGQTFPQDPAVQKGSGLVLSLLAICRSPPNHDGSLPASPGWLKPLAVLSLANRDPLAEDRAAAIIRRVLEHWVCASIVVSGHFSAPAMSQEK